MFNWLLISYFVLALASYLSARLYLKNNFLSLQNSQAPLTDWCLKMGALDRLTYRFQKEAEKTGRQFNKQEAEQEMYPFLVILIEFLIPFFLWWFVVLAMIMNRFDESD